MRRAVLVITAMLVGCAGGSPSTASPDAAGVVDVSVVESGAPAHLAAPAPHSTAALTTPTPRPSATTASPSQSTAASGTWVVVPVPAYTTMGGAGIAQTDNDGVVWTHTVTSNLEEALDGWDASVYERARGNGDRWSGERLLEGVSPAVAGAGSKVYVAMLAYRCGGIGVVRNVDHGRGRAWEPVRCLRRLRWFGSERAPEIAASGGTVIVSAAVPRGRHARAWVSHNRGRTWVSARLGLARGYGLGTGGVTRVAIDGQVAVVAWSDRRTIRARVSHDGGSTWGPRVTLGDGRVASAAVRDGQIVLAGVTRDGTGWMQVSFDGSRWDQVAVPATSDYAMLVAAIGPSRRDRPGIHRVSGRWLRRHV